MSNFGYGGGYSTTTHNAGGGADGGGFVSGSQQGSQTTPGGGKEYGKDSMRPVTIKQIIDAVVPYPDATPKIDGTEVTQLSVVAQVLKVSSQVTNTTFTLDDGTGTVDAKQWIDTDAAEDHAASLPAEGSYVHLWGRLKDFNGKRHIACHRIRPVTDFNEVSYHFLEATAVHLFFTRGPIDPEAGAVKNEGGNGMFVDSGAGANGNAHQSGASKVPSSFSGASKRIYKLMEEMPQSNEGINVHAIAQQLGIPLSEVMKGGDELLQGGQIYTTVDDETWAILEY